VSVPENTEQKTREPLPIPVTALILCGGKSRRMGRNKALLPFEGTTMVAHIVNTVSNLFNETLVVANEVETYEDLGVDVVKDILPYRGPLGGILSGLLVSSNHHVCVVPCDMPLIDRKLLRAMTIERHGTDVVVLEHRNGVEPLLGLYSKNCVKSLEESLFAENLNMQDLLTGLKAKTFKISELDNSDILPPYFNVDTPADYSRLIANLSENPEAPASDQPPEVISPLFKP
jgi:molybdopterin-guanine dinucleotide biosynthesis protein A